MTEQPKKTEWLTPQNMAFFAGLALAAFSSYQTFQSDAKDRLRSAEFRIEALEKVATRNDARLDNHDKQAVETNLRLDRLERRTR